MGQRGQGILWRLGLLRGKLAILAIGWRLGRVLGDLACGEVKQAVDGHLAEYFWVIAIGQFCDKICR